MNKEKEIEEMAEAIRARYSTDYCKNKNITSEIYKEVIKAQNEALELAIEDFKEHELKYLVEAGYRKAEEVRKETAKQIFDMVNELYEQANSMKGTVEFKCGALDALNDVLDIFYREYGFEVKE